MKTTLGYSTAKILGHVHSQYGRSPDSVLTSTVLDIAIYTDATQVRHLLGLVLYEVHSRMGIISCLSNLTSKGVDAKEAWDPATHSVALSEIKPLITISCLVPTNPEVNLSCM